MSGLPCGLIRSVSSRASRRRRAANADLHELQPGTCGTGADPAKPASGVAQYVPSVRKPTPRNTGSRELPSPFRQYRAAALRGERLLDDEAERHTRTWTSPADIARLLLMRRVPTPVPREHDLWRFRVLGAVIPDLDHVVAAEQENHN
jgi:hypothetical protein